MICFLKWEIITDYNYFMNMRWRYLFCQRYFFTSPGKVNLQKEYKTARNDKACCTLSKNNTDLYICLKIES